MRVKKQFGQHFLASNETALKIVQALGSLSDKDVLEIGPGLGVITQFMVNECKSFKCIEIDRDAVAILADKFKGMTIVNEDFLKTDLAALYTKPFHVIGNFPYNISSQIVFKIMEQHQMVESWVGMFQLEMGKRLFASPKDKKDYGILSVLLPFYYKVEEVLQLPPEAFKPPPKVNSIVLKASSINHEWKCDKKMLFRVVKAGFNQRRKTLANSLSSIVSKDILNQHQFANLRPEALTHFQFEELTAFVQEHVSNGNHR